MKFYDKLKIPNNYHYILNIVVVLIFFFILYNVYKFIDEKRKIKALQKEVSGISDEGAAVVRSNVGTKALEISNIMDGNFIYELLPLSNVNQERIIANILDVPKSLTPDLEKAYFDFTKNMLKTKLINRLSAQYWAKISDRF